MTARPVAFVTGASRGIGLAIARQLARDGFDLIVLDLDPDAGEVADSLRALGASVLSLTGDLGDLDCHPGWMAAISAGPGRVDCLVNNAGMGTVARGDVLDLTPENFDRVMGVNLRGTLFLTQVVLRLMLAQMPSPLARTIVNITSVSASHVSVERLDYCISKAALAMWSKGLAVRLAGDDIAVFDVRPGIIRSDMTAPVTEKYDRLIEGGLVPAGRWGEAQDVADVVASLATGRFGFATGTIIDVGGGLSIGRL